MARINRSDVIQKAVNDLAISATTDKVPNETLDKVQLTYDLNKRFSSFVVNTSSTTTGTMSLSLPTVDARQETYITNLLYSFAKDATCDIATGALTVQPTSDLQQIAKNLIHVAVITLTADAQTINVSFPYPLKVKNNSSIACGGTFTVGLLSRTVSVVGFTTSTN